jgi:hypothetical protein
MTGEVSAAAVAKITNDASELAVVCDLSLLAPPLLTVLILVLAFLVIVAVAIIIIVVVVILFLFLILTTFYFFFPDI